MEEIVLSISSAGQYSDFNINVAALKRLECAFQ